MHPRDVPGGDRPGGCGRSWPGGGPRRPGIEARRRDLADAAQGADGEVGLLGSNEREDPHARDSFPQKAVARFRISRPGLQLCDPAAQHRVLPGFGGLGLEPAGIRYRPALLSHRDSLRQAQPGRSGVHHAGGGSGQAVETMLEPRRHGWPR
jgi:hypothetical protein